MDKKAERVVFTELVLSFGKDNVDSGRELKN